MEVETEEYNVPSDKLYAVVELVVDIPNKEGETDVEKYVSPASTNWLKKVIRHEDGIHVKYFGTCMWPKDESKLSSYLDKRSKPSGDWITYPDTRILKFCRSIGQAKNFSQRALSETSLSESDGNVVKKRVPTKPQRLGYRRCIDEVHSETDEPPPVKSLKLSSKAMGGVDTKLSLKKHDKAPIQKDDNGKEKTASDNHPINQENREDLIGKRYNSSQTQLCFSDDDVNNTSTVADEDSNPFNIQSHPSSPVPQKLNVNYTPKTSRVPNTPRYLPRPKSSHFSPRKLTNASASVSHFTFMREIQDLRKSLASLKVSVNKIYNCVCPIAEKSNKNDDERGMPAMPAHSFDAMIALENYLKDHDNSLNVVRLLSERCVLSGLRESVNSMMKFILSNKLASSFNYKGKNRKGVLFKKVSFKDTRSCTAVAAALKTVKDGVIRSGSPFNYSTNPADIGNAMGLWLKDAPKRFLIDLKGSKMLEESVTRVPDSMFVIPPDLLDFASI